MSILPLVMFFVKTNVVSYFHVIKGLKKIVKILVIVFVLKSIIMILSIVSASEIKFHLLMRKYWRFVFILEIFLMGNNKFAIL